jgi:hypothetical protein
MNSATRQAFVIGAILLVLIGLGALASQVAQNHSPTTTSPSSTVTKTITYKGEDGKTVIELLERDHRVEKRDSEYGTFVTTIDGIAQTDNSFWLYYIDGQAATVAGDKAVTKNGQTIEWRYESF